VFPIGCAYKTGDLVHTGMRKWNSRGMRIFWTIYARADCVWDEMKNFVTCLNMKLSPYGF